MPDQSIYEKLGIDPHKTEVKNIYKKIVENHYPGAFVNIIPDPFHAGFVHTQHADGDGSKFTIRCLDYLENNDPFVFQCATDDALSMNLGDIAAAGFVNGLIIITQTININKKNVPKEIIMQQNALRMVYLIDLYKKHEITIRFLGGETADLPDQVKSVVYDINVAARTHEKNLIKGNIEAGDIIYGFASDGQAVWEPESNSGLGSNGLTLARSCLLSKTYNQKYPFLKRDGDFYTGKYLINDKPDILGGMTISEAILSPTRQYAILIKMIVDELEERGIFGMLHGITMNTGGGATKIINIGQGIKYIKSEMPPLPPIFQLIQQESGEKLSNMYTTFNGGVGIDVVGTDDPKFKDVLLKIADEAKIKLFQLGYCENNVPNINNVSITIGQETFVWIS